ncbi:MAG: phosphatidylglycerol:prolipoprotein diacylglycerol transferase [Kiritimatiellia bacterium]|jgi:phosphatidylglycerol:prolipoprotein diacylglycerol transferase
MFAAIPFFGLGVWNIPLGGDLVLPLDPWAVLVALGFIVGLEISRSRGIKLGLDVRDVVDGALFTVLSGFVIGHFYTVLFYYPHRLATSAPMWGLFDGQAMSDSVGIWSLLMVWTGFSSVGGFFGAIIGSIVFYRVIRKRDWFRFADVITYGFPVGWLLGRLGCGVVHDHIGSSTDVPIAMHFDHGLLVGGLDTLTTSPPGGYGVPADQVTELFMGLSYFYGSDIYPGVKGGHFELGLLEAAYMIPVIALWFWLGRKDRVPGFFTLLFFALYAPVRFGLDFLRLHDLLWAGLTPAQWGLIPIFIACIVGVIWLVRVRGASFIPWALDGSPKQLERAVAGGVVELPPAAAVGSDVDDEGQEGSAAPDAPEDGDADGDADG